LNEKTTIVLLIEDNPADARLILEALSAEIDTPFRVEWVTQLSAGLERLSREGVDVVMLDLSLPDVQGIEAVDEVCLAAPDLLILVLSGLTDEEVARQAVQRGAYDYFSKSHVDAHWLPRALR
jgi:DNA-binding response OmpR family regulator